MKRTWYLAALVPLAIGIVVSVLVFKRLAHDVESMHRMVAPGEHSFALQAGDYVVYGESKSVVDGTAYSTEQFSVRCALAKQDGSEVPLSHSTVDRTYELGGYAGSSMFEFELPSAETVTLACETGEGKAVLAIGNGIGTAIAVGVISGVVGFFGAIAVLVIVFIKRRRWKRRASEDAARAPAPGSAPPPG